MQADAITAIPKRRAIVLAGMLALSGATLAAEGSPSVAGGEVQGAPARVQASATSALDRRIALIARELDLDATQQLKVRALLEGQREQIVKVWQDESVSGALRVARTQAITEHTEDGIRALLTDAQRQKYHKARTDRPANGATSDDLATYVDKMDRR